MVDVPARAERIPGQPASEWSDETRAHLAGVVSTTPGAAPKPVHLPSVIAHHATFLGPYLEWAKAIALRGVLPPRSNALLALRTAWHRRSEFEWGVHANSAIARELLTADEVAALADADVDGARWSPADAVLLRAVDELCTIDTIDDHTWAELGREHSTDALLEITFVVGHYTMLSLVANTAGVPPLPEWPALPATLPPPPREGKA
jgi:hypothetical protein